MIRLLREVQMGEDPNSPKPQENEGDEADRVPSKARATIWDLAGFVISIISHLLDVGFDCNLAIQYYLNNHFGYFVTTLGFILIPAFINTVFSIRMYVLDHENTDFTTITKKFTKRRLWCAIVLIFQLSPVLRYIDAFRYARKSRSAEKRGDLANQRKYFELMAKEDSDVALLRVLECFLEAAPQLTLQLTIIFYTHGEGFTDTFTLFHQFLSIGSSFVSMAWSMASYQRLIRVSLKNKLNITWCGTIAQFMWHFLVTVSRILCISVVASIYPNLTIAVLIAHWFVMVVWLQCTSANNSFCAHNKIYDFLFYATFGAVYIFTQVVLVGGRTFCKYLIFYTILFVENTAANIVWACNADDDLKRSTYFQPIIILNVLPFILGLLFMLCYYRVCHPSTGWSSRRTLSDGTNPIADS